MIGMALLYLIVESKSFVVRRAVLDSLERLASGQPEVANAITSAALRHYLTKYLPSVTKATDSSSEDIENSTRADSRLSAVLLASASFSEEVEQDIREKALVDNIVLAHHQVLCALIPLIPQQQ